MPPPTRQPQHSSENTDRRATYAEILAGHRHPSEAEIDTYTDGPVGRGRVADRDVWDESEVDRLEHLDDMSDRPAGLSSAQWVGEDEYRQHMRRTSNPDASPAASPPTIPLITLDQLLDPDFRLSASRPGPSPSVSPRDTSTITSTSTNTRTSTTTSTTAGGAGLAVASGEAGDEAARDVLDVGPPHPSMSLGNVINNVNGASGSASVSGAGAGTMPNVTAAGTRDRRTPWRQMFLHPNAPIAPIPASASASAGPSVPPVTGSNASAPTTGPSVELGGVTPRRRNLSNPAHTPGPLSAPTPTYTWHTFTQPSASASSSTSLPTFTNGDTGAYRSRSPPSRAGHRSNAPARPAARTLTPTSAASALSAARASDANAVAAGEGDGRDAFPRSSRHSPDAPAFTETDYLNALPGSATFAEDAQLDLASDSGPQRLDVASAGDSGPRSGPRGTSGIIRWAAFPPGSPYGLGRHDADIDADVDIVMDADNTTGPGTAAPGETETGMRSATSQGLDRRQQMLARTLGLLDRLERSAEQVPRPPQSQPHIPAAGPERDAFLALWHQGATLGPGVMAARERERARARAAAAADTVLVADPSAGSGSQGQREGASAGAGASGRAQADQDVYSWLSADDEGLAPADFERDDDDAYDDADMDADLFDFVDDIAGQYGPPRTDSTTANPLASTGDAAGDGHGAGADLARGGNNRRRLSLRRTAAANAGHASASASATLSQSRSSPLALGRNAAGETTYAGHRALTMDEIMDWEPDMGVYRAGPVTGTLAGGGGGGGGRAGVAGVSDGQENDHDHVPDGAGLAATNLPASAVPIVVSSNTGIRTAASSTPTSSRPARTTPVADVLPAAGEHAEPRSRVRPRSPSAEEEDEGPGSLNLTEGADARKKRARLGNISPSPHDALTDPTATAPNVPFLTPDPYPSYLAYYPHINRSLYPLTFAPPPPGSNLRITPCTPTPTPTPLTASHSASSTHQLITFTPHPPPTHTDDDATALLSSLPVPGCMGLFYYEVTVQGSGAEGYMSMGFMRGDSNTNRLVGWDKGTWGYHADDGLLFEGTGKGRRFGETWGVGDVVGAGINFTSKRAFFTKNGKLIGTGTVPILPSLHPAIALRNVGESLQVNLSGPFAYDIDRVARDLQDQALESVNRQRVERVVPASAFGIGNANAVSSLYGEEVEGRYREMTHVGAKAGMELALVLEHLAHRGLDKVAALVKRDIQQRRLFDDSKRGSDLQADTDGEPQAEVDVKGKEKAKADAAAASELSIGARYRQAIAAATRHPLRTSASMYFSASTALSTTTVKERYSEHFAFTLQPRLAILDFVHDVLRYIPGTPAGSISRYTDTEAEAGAEAEGVPELSDILSQGRALQQATTAAHWESDFTMDHLAELQTHRRQQQHARAAPNTRSPSIAITSAQYERYLAEAFGLLALSHPLPADVQAVWAQRRAEWVGELCEGIRKEMGMREKSLLEGGMGGVGVMLQRLREKGDGAAACVRVGDVMGSEK